MPRTVSKAKVTEFKLFAPQAKRVNLAGDFNNWDISALSAKKDSKGNWAVKASLKPGRHEYKFYVDGSWVNDPRCKNYASNNFGTQNSVVEVK
ncbi:MAG TPA: isoamylase early set domain-containing protein [Patescibacteria group bacterium]|nr:isoamylase early set domain-containing protein [Patescibacteria group bacterium]